MSDYAKGLRFVVMALPANGAHPNELARTMAPHPLIHQELPYNPEYSIYNRRLPTQPLLSRVKASGCLVLGAATTVEEARWLSS